METKGEKIFTAIVKGVISGFVIFIIGFCIMNILWEISDKNTALRGFDYYLAAFWGDRICLPLFIGSMITYILFHKPIDRKRNMICILFGIGCAIIAILIQLQWIFSDNTILNWTIPRQHHFNFAGWYHAFCCDIT